MPSAVHRQDLGIEAKMATLQIHAEAQQEQIRMVEVVLQLLRANPTNPSPPLRAAFQKPGSEESRAGTKKKMTPSNNVHTFRIEVGADIVSLHGQATLLTEAESLQKLLKMTEI